MFVRGFAQSGHPVSEEPVGVRYLFIPVETLSENALSGNES
jgi:hypothetical protein